MNALIKIIEVFSIPIFMGTILALTYAGLIAFHQKNHIRLAIWSVIILLVISWRILVDVSTTRYCATFILVGCILTAWGLCSLPRKRNNKWVDCLAVVGFLSVSFFLVSKTIVTQMNAAWFINVANALKKEAADEKSLLLDFSYDGDRLSYFSGVPQQSVLWKGGSYIFSNELLSEMLRPFVFSNQTALVTIKLPYDHERIELNLPRFQFYKWKWIGEWPYNRHKKNKLVLYRFQGTCSAIQEEQNCITDNLMQNSDISAGYSLPQDNSVLQQYRQYGFEISEKIPLGWSIIGTYSLPPETKAVITWKPGVLTLGGDKRVAIYNQNSLPIGYYLLKVTLSGIIGSSFYLSAIFSPYQKGYYEYTKLGFYVISDEGEYTYQAMIYPEDFKQANSFRFCFELQQGTVDIRRVEILPRILP